ncbi:MAG: lysylphosphatidylglycerol synthase domain-containing protein [Thermoanaerobaculia bacterium]
MKLVERIFLIAGAALFVWLLHRIGLDSIRDNLARVGWGFAILIAFQGAILALDTLGWRFTLESGSRTDSFRSMFGMRLAGDAINYLTPTAAIGGEIVRYRLLSRTHPPAAAVGSVALLVINQFFSQVLFVLAGAPFVYLALGHRALQWGGALVSLALLLALLVGGLVFLGRRGDGLRRLRGLLHRFLVPTPPRPPATPPQIGEGPWEGSDPWQQVDDNVFGAYRRRPGDMFLSTFCFLLGWSVGIAEGAVILALLGVHVAWTAIVAIEALSVLVETALFFVPGKIGTQEGGKYFIFLSLGLDPATGFSFGLTRRVRELAWAFTGLIVLAVLQRENGGKASSRT